MCGIFCEIRNASCSTSTDSSILKCIYNRGPDGANQVHIQVNQSKALTLYASVLWMQGLQCTPQPSQSKNAVLLFNGDIFDETWDCAISDTMQIMQKFDNKLETDNSTDEIIDEIRKFKGPFSIIFYCKTSHDIIIARDRIGRNSLLFALNNEIITISSVLGRSYKCFEIPATYIIKLNVFSNDIVLYPWESGKVQKRNLNDWFETHLSMQAEPDEQYTSHFDNDLDENDMGEIENYIESASLNSTSTDSLMKALLKNDTIYETLRKTTDLLEKSVKIRLDKQPNKCQTCLTKQLKACDHCPVAVLFSGGLDCTILALLADKYLPKNQCIELLNVAFNKDGSSNYDVPDRKTGLQSFVELKTVCPLRKWIFKELNVTKDELHKYQKSRIADLVYPRQTILDESLGSALWFASRGEDETSTSKSRVLLLGSGADELFGGYTRHRNAFKRQGWFGLQKELQLDWHRISSRNLSRDNRVLCDHGRQPRLPYLDEAFTQYVLNLKPWLKCYFSDTLGPGIGDKLMLRLVAFNLGLTQVATFPKRALQFGSRIANKKEKGSDISKTFAYSLK